MRKKLQIALIILAVVSGITTMLSAPVLVRCGSFLALAIALLCLLLSRVVYGGRVPQVDPLGFLPQAPYTIYAASEDDICWSAQTARQVYSGVDIIPVETMLEWFHANPNGFSIIKDHDGHRCGNIDILPLKPDTLSRFLRGDLIEREIRGESIIRTKESKEIESLYVESIVAISEKGKGNPLATYKCIISTPDLVKRICTPSQVKVFSISFCDLCRNIARHANGNDKSRLKDILDEIGAEPVL
jgi:hypothetical protein